MSSFDENIAELRGIGSTSRQPAKPESRVLTDLETQPLLNFEGNTSYIAENTEHSIDTTPASTDSFASMPLFFTLSTIFGASSVALGAFGAHGLKRRISDPARLANWSTAANYQLVHSVALLAMSLTLPRKAQRIPGSLLVAGMTMFSGSLYLLVLDPQRFGMYVGPVTPIGGLCLIGGWVSLGVIGRRFVRM